jgi:hypothetical protein
MQVAQTSTNAVSKFTIVMKTLNAQTRTAATNVNAKKVSSAMESKNVIKLASKLVSTADAQTFLTLNASAISDGLETIAQ